MAQFNRDSSQQWRLLKDKLVRYGVMLGGISVIAAIVLIFFYLVFVVWPLFESPTSEVVAAYQMPGTTSNSSKTLHLSLDERGDIGGRITTSGEVVFFHTKDGSVITRQQLPSASKISSVAVGELGKNLLALGMDDGQTLLLKIRYVVSYPNDLRTVTPELEFPYGEEPLEIVPSGSAIEQIAFRDSEEMLTIVTSTKGGVQIARFTKESSMLDDEVTLEKSSSEYASSLKVAFILLDPDQKRLYLAEHSGAVEVLSIGDLDNIEKVETINVLSSDAKLTSFDFLLGGISIIAGSDQGELSQWFSVRDKDHNYLLTKIRSFDTDKTAVTTLAMESRRKGFISGDRQGNITIFHATAQRTVMSMKVSEHPLTKIVSSPRADFVFAEDAAGKGYFWHVSNHHPEISWGALWGKVQYEGYDDKRYIWQSSSASNDFEPKFSLMPLAFGTLKAAFYAMLFAVPMSILGAIYTAYFMAPRMRQWVKPTIEIMEALPTVILGFLAGLWLAPLMESHLPGVFSVLLILPIGILITSFLWWKLPSSIRRRVPDGWEAVILIPVIIGLVWFSFTLSLPMEEAFFGGDMRSWMYNEFGIGFDQRNSLVIGLAMGFAVIPTIFSITEDAIFSVPKHLTLGSLALGATPWQTLIRVVILTASPGIFSAVMIGLGRAVGETMIVLMATGNTPVMDFSVFEGMRTLAANIAVEMPESEVDSSHYRILFLAALVLLSFTFVVNTLAEIVRHRLRKKYSSL
ncbi:MAG: ABC transporter permease subunit [Chromatiales bacterium]|nr:ABC transporter permease subunit [Chromatiales bacterium]